MSFGTRAALFPVLVAAVATAGLIAGCSSDTGPSTPTTSAVAGTNTGEPAAPGAAQPASTTVQVDDMKFSPADITIKVGDTVTWKFSDKVPHAVQGIGDSAMGINSPIFTDGEWSHTFDVAGSYRYLCPLHPEMRGTVTVE